MSHSFWASGPAAPGRTSVGATTETRPPSRSMHCRTRAPRDADSGCEIVSDADVVAAHLEDAAHYPGGHAGGVAYPRSEAAVARLVTDNRRVLTVGAQSSLTGGATP